MPVVITVHSDKSFTFEVKQPPVAISLKEAAKLQKGSGEPNRRKVASITWIRLAIAEGKMPDLNAFTLASAMKMVAATQQQRKVTGKFPGEPLIFTCEMSRITKNQKGHSKALTLPNKSTLAQACEMLKGHHLHKFDASVDFSANLGVDPRKVQDDP